MSPVGSSDYRLPPRWPEGALVAVVAIALLVFAYCAGSNHGATHTTVAAIEAHEDTVRDTIRVVVERVKVDTVRLRMADGVAVARREAFDSVAKAVEAVADTSAVVPTSLATLAVQSCTFALEADSLRFNAAVATIHDLESDLDAEHALRMDDERELKILKPPRFGWRSGALMGIAAALAVVHFLR